jgi:hypothetical protein
MKKGSHPSLERIGFQPGHQPFFDFKKLHEILLKDTTIKEKWLNAKRGKKPWNKGITKSDYPNGTAFGPDHGNWRGNKRGLLDLSVYKLFTAKIRRRDNFTCQICGARKVVLDVHHVIPISHNLEKALDPSNCVTLCKPCHRKTDTYGTKANRKKKSGN